MDFPIFKTKIEQSGSFNLNDPEERKRYFELKADPEIKKLREYLKRNTFVVYLLGKKNSGKGTYSKLFMEVVDSKNTIQFSVGDIVRNVHQGVLEDEKKRKDLMGFLEKNYRGYISHKEVLQTLLNRNTETLLPTEFVLALIKREIANLPKKSLFIDGFPRGLDQVSYSLFFRDLIGYRDDSDIFVLIDVPEAVIDERMKWRRVCPKCQTPRNLKLLPTKDIGYDENKKEFYLFCDNPGCRKTRMVSKEGDISGIGPIKKRLEEDAKLMERAFSLYGIPKILLRNSIPADVADDYIDKYEITPEYSYEWDGKNKKIKIIEKPWIISDDRGISSVSLLAPPVAVSLIKQMAEVLHL